MIGNEWGPLIINSEEEFNITESLISLLGLCVSHAPLVGGSIIRMGVNYYENPEFYFPNNSGKCKSSITMLILLPYINNCC